MKKQRFLSLLLALCLIVTMLPVGSMTAWAADPITGGNVIKITSWDEFTVEGLNQYDPNQYDHQTQTYKLSNGLIADGMEFGEYERWYKVPNGYTLDLSALTTAPDRPLYIGIEEGEGTTTIVGNTECSFGGVTLLLAPADASNRNTTEAANISMVLQDFRFSGRIETDENDRSSDYYANIQYRGTVSTGNDGIWLATSSGNTKCLHLKFQGGSNDTWISNGGIMVTSKSANASITFEGGNVISNFIAAKGSTANVSIKDCNLDIDSVKLWKGTYVYSNPGIEVIATGDSSTAESKICIDNSIVNIVNDTISKKNEYSSHHEGFGGIIGGDKIEIKNNSQVTVTTEANTKNGEPAIGNTGDVLIDHSTVVAAIEFIGENSTSGSKNSAGIGGEYDTITIQNGSNVTAIGYHGAGIGRSGATIYTSDEWNTDETKINISDSTVNAYSTYGAGIGSGWVGSGYVNTRTSQTNITISGNSDVTAVSQYGAGIGAGGVTEAIPVSKLELTLDMIIGWGTDVDYGGEDGPAYMSFFPDDDSIPASTPSSGSRTNTVTDLATDNGTLTITGNPTVNAESGVKAVSLPVTAGSPMMEYTLDTSETPPPEVSTPINRTSTGTDNGAGAPSYNLRRNFRSLAFYPVSEGTYGLSYGTTDPDPLLDVNNSYSDSYTLTSVSSGTNALQSFTVVRQRDLGGSVTLSADGGEDTDDGKVIVDTTLTAVLTGLTPSGIQESDVSYQWYRNGEAITDANGSSYKTTADDDGAVIHCVVTGTGLYRGSVESQAVTVASTPDNVPAPPTANTITADSITLNVPDDGNAYEYSIDGGKNWQPSPIFTGLDRLTDYSFVQRVKSTDSTVNPTSAAATFTTLSGKPATPVITITSYENETFTVNESGVSVYSDSTCQNKITGSYITDYIGKTIYAKYDSETEINENTVATVNVPSRPTLQALGNVSSTPNSLSLVGVAGVEYGLFELDTTNNVPKYTEVCQNTGDLITFTGLAPQTEYEIRARIPASEANQQFASRQSGVRAYTEVSKTTISITPGENVYQYDGNAKAFTNYTVLPSDIDTSALVIKYQKVNGDTFEDVENPTEIGIYNVIIARSGDDKYNGFYEHFAAALTIEKGQVTGTPIDETVITGTTTPQTVNISIDTNAYGDVTGYSIGAVEGRDFLNTDPTVTNGVLTYQVASTTASGSTITIPVIVSTTNYDVTVTVTVNVTDKKTATVTVTQEGCVSGETLPDPIVKITGENNTALTGSYQIQYSGTVITGEKYDTSTNKPTQPGSYTVTVIYDNTPYYGTGTADFIIKDTLGEAQNLAWSSETPGTATWSAVDHADSYTVKLYKDGETGVSMTVYNVTETTNSFTISEAGSYTFTVTAVANTDNQYYVTGNESEKSAALHTVSFNSNGGGDIAMQLIKDGEKVQKPAAPEILGLTLEGWYNGSSKWTFESDAVTASMTLTAQYNNTPKYTVTIPESVTLGDSAAVSASGVNVASGWQLEVALTATSGTNNAFTLESDEKAVISYTVQDSSGGTIAINDTVLTVAGGIADNSGSATLNFIPPETVTYAGRYTGSITFTVSVKDAV